ncbi:hypothetical protein GOBAR_DD20959 [Gossypium barbadense]|nr:hypothetical protein GOBAR_DD20959 [Gossypium barbadense]
MRREGKEDGIEDLEAEEHTSELPPPKEAKMEERAAADVRLRYIGREHNKVADLLSGVGSAELNRLSTFDAPPSSAVSLLAADINRYISTKRTEQEC